MIGFTKQKQQKEAKKRAKENAKALSETKNWYRDRFERTVVQRNVLFLLTVLSLIGLGLAVNSVARLNASKVFEPFVIEVEERTGRVTKVDSGKIERYSQSTSIIQYFVKQYVRAREGYEPNLFRSDKYLVELMSDKEIKNQYKNFVNSPTGPRSLGFRITRRVNFKSVQKVGKNKLQIGLVTTDLTLPAVEEVSRKNHILIVEYKFEDYAMSPKDRELNPLGFQITYYNIEEEEVFE